MQPGTAWAPIDGADVDTPEVGIFTYIDAATLTLWGKFPDGSYQSLTGGTGSQIASQAVNTGTANALAFAITGAALVSGNIYYVTVNETNTGAVTVTFNALATKAVKYKGTIAAAIPASTFIAGSTIALIYDGTQFQFVGTVKGGLIVSNFNVTYVEAAVLGAGTATATMDLLYLPEKSALMHATCFPRVIAAAPALTAAALTFTNLESGLDVFGGSIDNFVPVAQDKGGVSNGLKSNSDIPYNIGTQTYRMTWVLTTDIWSGVTTGEFNLTFAWAPIS